MGTALVLLNTGIDELGNPRLRDASHAAKIGGRRQRPADPTPVLHAAPARPRSRLAASCTRSPAAPCSTTATALARPAGPGGRDGQR